METWLVGTWKNWAGCCWRQWLCSDVTLNHMSEQLRAMCSLSLCNWKLVIIMASGKSGFCANHGFLALDTIPRYSLLLTTVRSF